MVLEALIKSAIETLELLNIVLKDYKDKYDFKIKLLDDLKKDLLRIQLLIKEGKTK